MLAVNWFAGAHRNSRCPACGAVGRKQHLLDTAVPADGSSTVSRIALLKCDECGVRYGDPLVFFDYHDSDPDGIATKYYVEQGAGIDVMLEPLSMLDNRAVQRYLEIGCSFGFGMEYARRVLGWDVLGYDPGAIAEAGKRMLGLPIRSSLFDGRAVPDRSFDLVFCSEVIEHIPDPNPFVDMLRRALRDAGALLLTTPNGEVVAPGQPDEVLAPVLSPGQHVILYNARSIEHLLRRHGFREIRVRENITQLQILATTTSLGDAADYFTRERYRKYLEEELDVRCDDRQLVAGFGYRLMLEDVNHGRLQDALATYERLRAGYRTHYGYDIEAPETVAISSASGLSFTAFGRRFPFNLAGTWYARGIVALNDDRDAVAAARYFTAAIEIGEALRSALNAIGTDDPSVADLGRAAAVARLSALAQCDPRAAAQELDALRQRTLRDGSPPARLHLVKAARQLFVDLTNLGNLELADEIVSAGMPTVAELLERAVIPAAIVWARHSRLVKGGTAAATIAIDALATLSSVVLAERAAKPDDPLFAGFLAEIEIAQVLVLLHIDRPRALAALREVARNPHRLDAASHALAERQLFTDLVNLGEYALAEELTGSRLPINHPLRADELTAANACGIYLLNHQRDLIAASEIFSDIRQTILSEVATSPDAAVLLDLMQAVEIAHLVALVQVNPPRALDAFREIARNPGALEPAMFALHHARAERRFFTDLVNLGEYALAEELIGARPLPLARSARREELAAANACGIYLLNHKRDAAAASEIFSDTRQQILAELSNEPADRAPLGDLLQAVEISLLSALAFVGRAEALAIIEQIELNGGRLGADAFAAHIARVHRCAAGLFADLGYDL